MKLLGSKVITGFSAGSGCLICPWFFFLVSALAETNRPPFDLQPRRSWLQVSSKYASTPYLLFMIGELSAVLLMTALMTFIFGGWLSPVSFMPDGVFGCCQKCY